MTRKPTAEERQDRLAKIGNRLERLAKENHEIRQTALLSVLEGLANQLPTEASKVASTGDCIGRNRYLGPIATAPGRRGH